MKIFQHQFRQTMPLLAILLPVIINQGGAKAESIQIIVREEVSGTGVPSDVVLLKGGNVIPVDHTDSMGTLSLTHECAIGEQFRAEPRDASFYYSDPESCKKSVILPVTKRATPIGGLAKRETKVVTVTFPNGLQASYLVAWNSRVGVKTDESNRTGPPPGPNRPPGIGPCNLMSTVMLERTVTLLTTTGDPSQLALPPPSHIVEPGPSHISSFKESCDSSAVESKLQEFQKEAVRRVQERSAQDANNILMVWAREKGYQVEIKDFTPAPP